MPPNTSLPCTGALASTPVTCHHQTMPHRSSCAPPRGSRGTPHLHSSFSSHIATLSLSLSFCNARLRLRPTLLRHTAPGGSAFSLASALIAPSLSITLKMSSSDHGLEGTVISSSHAAIFRCDVPRQVSAMLRSPQQIFALLKSISGCCSMNFLSMSCFDCSSAVGRPAAFCRWSYLRCGSGRGGGQGEAVVGACESARAAERGRGEGEGEVEGGLAARHVGSGAARGHDGSGSGSGCGGGARGQGRQRRIIFSTVWRVSPSSRTASVLRLDLLRIDLQLALDDALPPLHLVDLGRVGSGSG